MKRTLIVVGVATILLLSFTMVRIRGGQINPSTTLFDIVLGYPQRAKPQKAYDSRSTPIPARFSSMGELYINSPVQTKHILVDEGSYFTAGTTTSTSIGSGITIDSGNNTSFSATKGILTIKDNDQPGPNSKRIYVDYFKLFNWTTAPTGSASVNLAIELDNISRQPTAGNGALTIVNPNMDDITGSVAQVAAINGNPMMTVPAAGPNARQTTQCLLRSSIPVVRDSLQCFFGTVDGAGSSNGTAAGRIIDSAAPFVIGPQQTAVIHVWFPGASAGSIGAAEYEIGWWER